MPSLIAYESWDGVSAPALPSDWSFGVGNPLVTSSSPTGGITPLSAPNVLACLATGDNTHWAAIWQTPDSTGGNVLVVGSFDAAATTSNQTYGLLARLRHGDRWRDVVLLGTAHSRSNRVRQSGARPVVRRGLRHADAVGNRPEHHHIDRRMVYALARLPGFDDRRHAHAGERWVLPHQLGHVASRPDDGDQS